MHDLYFVMEGSNTSKGPASGGGYASQIRKIDGRSSVPVKHVVRNTFPKKGGNDSKLDDINLDNKNRSNVHYEEYTAPLKSDSGKQNFANGEDITDHISHSESSLKDSM